MWKASDLSVPPQQVNGWVSREGKDGGRLSDPDRGLLGPSKLCHTSHLGETRTPNLTARGELIAIRHPSLVLPHILSPKPW